MKQLNNSTIQQFKKQLLLLALLIVLTINMAISQNNILKVIGGETYTNDSVEISIDIDNDNSFISFQCDILLPTTMQYIEGSAMLTERSQDHVLNTSVLQNNRLRLFSYSLNNKKFLSNSGTVATLKINSGDLEGIYELIVENAIIGDSASNNIITDSVNGTVNVSPAGIFERKIHHDLGFLISPNPYHQSFNLHVELKEYAELTIKLISVDGKGIILNKHLGCYTSGEHMINSERFLEPGTEYSQTMLIRLCAKTNNNRILTGIKKVIKTNY